MEKANRKQTIFSSKPLGVTAWIFSWAKRCFRTPSTIGKKAFLVREVPS
jgi:hypothetical protein